MEGNRVILRVVLPGQGCLSSGGYLFQHSLIFLLSKSKLDDSIPVLARDIIVVHTPNDVINSTLDVVLYHQRKKKMEGLTEPISIRGLTIRGNIAGM